MLDERGVEWSDSSDENVLHTTWNAMRCWFTEYPDGWTGWGMAMSGSPEQAIEATLGPVVPPPEPPVVPYDVLIDLLRDEWDIEVMWDGLRRFWYVGLTDEGVRKRDEREATLGRGTCKPVDGYDDDGEEIGTVCSECGSPWPIYYVVRYCPVCGCKVVDDASVD